MKELLKYLGLAVLTAVLVIVGIVLVGNYQSAQGVFGAANVNRIPHGSLYVYDGIYMGNETYKIDDYYCTTFSWNPPALYGATAASSTATTTLAWATAAHLPAADKGNQCDLRVTATSTIGYNLFCNVTANDGLTASSTVGITSFPAGGGSLDLNESYFQACFIETQ